MKYDTSATPGIHKVTMGRRSTDREDPHRRSLSGVRRNRCAVFPANASMVAQSLERRNDCWFVKTKDPTDLIIGVGESMFHLHKLAMVSKSEYLNRVIFQKMHNSETDNTKVTIKMDAFPGGAETFELVVKFCYGWKFDLTVTNIAPIYCAAGFLEMSEEIGEGNLLSKTETFLSFVIFSSWKETFQILKTCEPISSWAEEFQITKRGSESIAWKACVKPKTIDCCNSEKVVDSWWIEDVSSLNIDHFVQVMESITRRGMRTELVGACLTYWAAKWAARINPNSEGSGRELQKRTIESLIRVLPEEDETSVSFNFLLHLLKLGLMVKTKPELSMKLEKRIVFMLAKCRPVDLLVKNYEDKDGVYDVEIVSRVIEAYISCISNNTASRVYDIGKLVDGYLTLIARDENLSVKSFRLIVELLPKNYRYCDDNLYRAIDMYLKAHPSLTEEERKGACKTMEYHKLSQEARKHMMKNDRLPLRMTTQFILLEQINMMRSMMSVRSNYRRTETQATVRLRKDSEKQWMKCQKEIKIMKQDMERMKVQVREMQLCRVELQRQVRKGIT